MSEVTVRTAGTVARTALGKTIPEKKLAFFFRNFGRLLATGMSIPESLERAASGADPELLAICRRAIPKLRAGSELFRALEPDRGRFPELTLPVLEVGEVSGTLEGAAHRLAEAFDRIDGFDSKFRRAKVDPVKIVLGAVFFRAVFSGGGEPVAVILGILQTALTAIIAIFVLKLVHRNLFRWPSLHALVDKIHLAIPHVGAIERSVASARWARSFSTMWHAGVPISLTLEVASRSSLNAYYERQLMKAAEATRMGLSIAQSLEKVELLPKHLLPILNVGHESSRFSELLDHFVDAVEEEAIVKAQQESAGAALAMYLVMGFIALMIALGTLAGTR